MIKNRRFVMLLCALMLMLTASMAAEAAMTVRLSGTKRPTTLKVGAYFDIAGVVSVSNGKLSKGVVSIYDSTGNKCLQKYTKNLSGTTFNIAEADPYISFNKLKAGKYYYRVSIYDTAGKKYRIINSQFTVGSTTASKLNARANNVSVPKTLKKGSTFSLSGTITSSVKMSKAVVTIYDSTGNKCLQRYTATVNANTYNVAKADPYLTFNSLAEGSYYYRISVYDASGNKERVVNSKFSVTSGSSIKISGALPSSDVTLTKGKTYSIAGTITSTNVLTNVTAKILNSNGKLVYGKGVNPASKTYKLKNSALSSALYFEKLSAGTYRYQVLAKDSTNKIVKLVDRKITVKAAASSTKSKDIQLLYVKPETDITIPFGSSYSLGGVVAGKYALKNLALVVKNSSNAVVVKKSVNINARTYVLEKSALDAAVKFESYPRSVYKVQITAKDSKGTSVVVMNKKVTIK